MPSIDEDLLGDLMHRATSDLHASPAVAAGIAARSRRAHVRTRALGAGAAGVAVATAVGVAVATSATSAAPAAPVTGIRLTAAQRTLTHLSLTAATEPARHGGRYVEMAELQGKIQRTTIIDAKTGDAWTYQAGPGVPATLPVDRHGSPTSAQLAGYPTGMHALRSLLVAQATHDLKVGLHAELAMLRKKDPQHYKQVKRELLASVPKETRSDQIFSQAAYLLWNPLVGPSLRSALFKVLAATPGIIVNAHATDRIGRTAIEISRFDKAANYTEAIFESPDGAMVLETVSLHPATPAHDGLAAERSYSEDDTYLTISWHNKLPASTPYRK